MDKIKNIDYQQLLVDHGEKLALGMIAVICLFAIWGTSWATTDLHPEQFKSQARATREAMLSPDNSWPEEERKKHLDVPDISLQASRLQEFDDDALARLSYSADMTWPLIDRQEPISPINFLPLDQMIASTGKFLMPARRSREESEDEEEGEEFSAEELEEAHQESMFEIRKGRSGGGAAGGADADLLEMMMGGEAYGGGRSEQRNTGGGGEEADLMVMMMGGDAYGGAGTGGEREAQPSEGLHYVAIRGLFPLRETQRNVAAAMHLSKTAKILKDLVAVNNFEVQRKARRPGNSPWSGEWVPVDLRSAIEILARADGQDGDVIAPAITDPVITQPLPPRFMGHWTDDGSHPGLAKYELSEEDKELLRKHNEMLEEVNLQSNEGRQRGAGASERGGFAALSRDIREYRRNIMTDSDLKTEYERSWSQSLKDAGEDPAEAQRRLRSLETEAAGSHLLLFRFFDLRSNQARPIATASVWKCGILCTKCRSRLLKILCLRNAPHG